MEDKKFKYVIEEAIELISQSCASESSGLYITPCIYCGMPASSVDHIPPQSMRMQLGAVELAAIHEQEVPACRECNSALGARPLLTVTERRAYVKDWLRRHYASYLRIPEWCESDLLQLGAGLQGMIRRNIAVRDDVRKRLRWKTNASKNDT